MNLPDNYLAEMKSLLGESDYNLYIESFKKSGRNGLRLNRLKCRADMFGSLIGRELVPVPFIDNAFFIEDKEFYTKHPFYYAGVYYIQEPSAMTPASMLDIKPEDRVLDLCAAPGGKTTELISKKPAFLLANDISYSRTIPLVKNIELFGGNNYCVTAEAPEKLTEEYPAYFDKILVDAPCSGEGMFRKDHSLISAWQSKGPEEYSELQYNILSCAVKMLRQGGELIYSTCTFSKCEDEEVIGRVLSENPDLYIKPMRKYEGFSVGFASEKYPDIDFSECIRLFPHKIEGEGHFVCKLHKKDSVVENNSDSVELSELSINEYSKAKSLKTKSAKIKDLKYKSAKFKLTELSKLPQDAVEFLNLIKFGSNDVKFLIQNDNLYLISEQVADSLRNNLRYTRTGQLIGSFKNGKYFSPYSGFALSLGTNDFKNIINFPSEDERTIKYLKGETIFPAPNDNTVKKGYVLVCTDNFPLGFAKFDGTKYKNLYNPGWRLNG